MRTLNVALPEEAAEQLRALAARERRAPRHQAAIIIMAALRALATETREPGLASKAGQR